jgi:hypothetical protein
MGQKRKIEVRKWIAGSAAATNKIAPRSCSQLGQGEHCLLSTCSLVCMLERESRRALRESRRAEELEDDAP